MAKAATGLAALIISALLAFLVVSNFIIGVLTDDRVRVSRNALAAAANYFPNSARLEIRLAREFEKERLLAEAESHATRAINMSPYRYDSHLLVAAVRESAGEFESAERSLKEALALAPNKTEVRWQLANLLLRRGDLEGAVAEFRRASALDKKLLPVSLNLVWRASNADLNAVTAVAGEGAEDRLALANFLLKQNRIEQAADVFSRVERARWAGEDRESAAAFFNTLINEGHPELARKLWAGSEANQSLISNGGFESEVVRDLAQFDWRTYNGEHAKVRVGAGRARTGSRSLRIDFAGRETTRLDGEIKQLIVVRPGARYRLECYAKAEKLIATSGPQVVITTTTATDWLAASEPVSASQSVSASESDWQPVAVEFTAPPNVTSLFVTIKRRPLYSYDEPMRGSIFFDDFTLIELASR